MSKELAEVQSVLKNISFKIKTKSNFGLILMSKKPDEKDKIVKIPGNLLKKIRPALVSFNDAYGTFKEEPLSSNTNLENHFKKGHKLAVNIQTKNNQQYYVCHAIDSYDFDKGEGSNYTVLSSFQIFGG